MNIIHIDIDNVFSVLVTLVIGFIVAACVKRMMRRWNESAPNNKGIFTFLASFCSVSIQIVTVVIALSQLGVNTNVIVGALSACTLGISMAMKDSMANVAGGIQILLTKPFDVGDFIKTSSYEGTVNRIEVMYTVLQTTDNQDVIVPNSHLVSNTIVNYSNEEWRRIHIQIPIGSQNDIEKCTQLFYTVLNDHPYINREKEHRVEIDEFKSTSVVMGIYGWCPRDKYWDVLYALRKELHKKRIEEGIAPPHDSVTVDSIS